MQKLCLKHLGKKKGGLKCVGKDADGKRRGENFSEIIISNSKKVYWIDAVGELAEGIISQLQRKDLYPVQFVCNQ